MTVFENGVKHYTTKFDDLMKGISAKSVESAARSHGFSTGNLELGLKSNSKEFKTFCHAYANSLIAGRVSCCTYAAVVATVAKMFGHHYEAYAGFCLQHSSVRYERDKRDWEGKKAQGVEHPFFANHVFLVVDGQEYEFYNGDTDGIEHLDVVKIAEG